MLRVIESVVFALRQRTPFRFSVSSCIAVGVTVVLAQDIFDTRFDCMIFIDRSRVINLTGMLVGISFVLL
jgi:hypothetical protein